MIKHKVLKKKKIEDKRGSFIKVIDGNEAFNRFNCEVYITVAKPNEFRGCHYHNTANEWFHLVKGQCNLVIEDIETHERKILKLNASENTVIHIPPKIAHIFINTSDENEFILLAYTDVQYDKTDTIPYQF